MSNDNGLFSKFGVELEYMLVRRNSLEVAPVADHLLHGDSKVRKNERRWGDLRVSNELVMHVLEFKTDGPAPTLAGLAERFQNGIRSVNTRLAEEGMRLLPGAMHPWMDPHRETVLWPYGDRAIYETFDRIFDCRGHGWSNLQSTHLNLPFETEEEFVRLHRALRWVLPLVPALAASSPFLDGRARGLLDHRLDAYRENCRRIPSITARVVPENVSSIAQYRSDILGRIATDLAPHDPQGVLEAEWVNARGTIARFERGTIEMRVMDVQECPAADLAILQFVVALLRALTTEEGAQELERAKISHDSLVELFDRAVKHGPDAVITDPRWSHVLLSGSAPRNLREAARRLAEVYGADSTERDELTVILEEGCLAKRLLARVGAEPPREALREVYVEIADCLETGRLFRV